MKSKTKRGAGQDKTAQEGRRKLAPSFVSGEAKLGCALLHRQTQNDKWNNQKTWGKMQYNQGKCKRSQGGEATETFVSGEGSRRAASQHKTKRRNQTKSMGRNKGWKKGSRTRQAGEDKPWPWACPRLLERQKATNKSEKTKHVENKKKGTTWTHKANQTITTTREKKEGDDREEKNFA